MTIRDSIILTILFMLPAALIGGLVAGVGGLKLAIGISVMFGMTLAVIIYGLSKIESEHS